MNKIKVLLTAAGSPSAPGLIDCLKKNGEREIEVIGTDMKNDPTIKQMVDKLYIVPACTESNYIDKLFEICKKEKVDVLIPGISQELEGLRERYQDFFEIGTKVSVSLGEHLITANDKIKLYDFMKKNGFDVPKFCIVNKKENLLSACESIGYPESAVCIKIKDGSGSRGVRIIDSSKSRFDIFMNEKPNSLFTTMDDFLSMIDEVKEIPELMVMEYLPGEEYSVDLLADNGDILYIAGRESNIVLASIPQEATIAENKDAYKIATELTKLMNLDGNLDFDFKFDENGKPKLLEINPRLAATLSIFAAAGVNLLYLRVKQLLGEKLPELEINQGVKMKRRYLEFFSDKNQNKITL